MVRTYDKILFFISTVLLVVGFFIFVSSAMGILAKDIGDFFLIVSKQLLFGVVFGLVGLFIFAKADYQKWSFLSPYLFIFSILLTSLVFLPGVGIKISGALRWISVGSLSFQPAEFLKLGFVLGFAFFLSKIGSRVQHLGYGLVGSISMLAAPAFLLFSQPDTGTLISIVSAWLAMFLVAGGRWKHFFLLVLMFLTVLSAIVYLRPYAMARVLTFIDPLSDPTGAGYQIRQSLIAVGSGEIFGRGFGQSIQKFKFLPEAVGDSIFAVAMEEFGFIGGVILISLFLAFALRGLKIASLIKDLYGRLVVVGIVILIISQSFVNMGAMLGILPLTGMPLLFVSHGGTALLFTLVEVGIVLGVSKYLT